MKRGLLERLCKLFRQCTTGCKGVGEAAARGYGIERDRNLRIISKLLYPTQILPIHPAVAGLDQDGHRMGLSEEIIVNWIYTFGLQTLSEGSKNSTMRLVGIETGFRL